MNSRSPTAPQSPRSISRNMPVRQDTAEPVVKRSPCVRRNENDFGIVNNNENTMGGTGRDGAGLGSESLESLGKNGAVRCNGNNGSGRRKQAGNNGTTTRNNTPWNRGMCRAAPGLPANGARACRSLLIQRLGRVAGEGSCAASIVKACRSLLIQRFASLRAIPPGRRPRPRFLDSPRGRRYKSEPSGPPLFTPAQASRAGSRMSKHRARPRRLIP
jgi:hypothetical protein